LAGICAYEHNSEAKMQCWNNTWRFLLLKKNYRTQKFTFSQVLIVQGMMMTQLVDSQAFLPLSHSHGPGLFKFEKYI
jgi:hypothetical protein